MVCIRRNVGHLYLQVGLILSSAFETFHPFNAYLIRSWLSPLGEITYEGSFVMSRYNYLVEELAQHIKWFDNESKTHKKLYGGFVTWCLV